MWPHRDVGFMLLPLLFFQRRQESRCLCVISLFSNLGNNQFLFKKKKNTLQTRQNVSVWHGPRAASTLGLMVQEGAERSGLGLQQSRVAVLVVLDSVIQGSERLFPPPQRGDGRIDLTRLQS